MKRLFRFTFLIALTALVIQPLAATTMLQLDLAQLTERAGRIFRGTVVDVEQGTIEAGGGELPAVTYKLRVDDLFKGEADLVKGDKAMIEIRMVGSIKDSLSVGDPSVRHLPGRAEAQMGSDYLLFVTPQSDIGLSVSVGLGQGAFSVFPVDKQDCRGQRVQQRRSRSRRFRPGRLQRAERQDPGASGAIGGDLMRMLSTRVHGLAASAALVSGRTGLRRRTARQLFERPAVSVGYRRLDANIPFNPDQGDLDTVSQCRGVALVQQAFDALGSTFRRATLRLRQRRAAAGRCRHHQLWAIPQCVGT